MEQGQAGAGRVSLDSWHQHRMGQGQAGCWAWLYDQPHRLGLGWSRTWPFPSATTRTSLSLQLKCDSDIGPSDIVPNKEASGEAPDAPSISFTSTMDATGTDGASRDGA